VSRIDRGNWKELAAAELECHGAALLDLEISGYAIDRASLIKAIRATWYKVSTKDEDLRAWLIRMGFRGWV